MEVVVNGVKAYTLFDSGCTTDSIAPDMAHIAQAERVKLKEQVGLQLGCIGSQTKINYGAWVNLTVGPVSQKHYVDVVNIDRYDLILGTVFCHKHGVVLDFQNRVIRFGEIQGTIVEAMPQEEEAELLRKR